MKTKGVPVPHLYDAATERTARDSIKVVLILLMLIAAFAFFVAAAWISRRGFGWLVPAGLALWILTTFIGRFIAAG